MMGLNIRARSSILLSTRQPSRQRRTTRRIAFVAALLAPGLKLTGGVKNIFNTDPPFAITYDGNTGAGSSWEPRVADPRGRSFTFAAEVKF